MSFPRCGSIYELELAGAEATHVVVLTEDLWNERMGDSVVVPLYDWPHATPSLALVAADDRLRANCTRVQSMAHEFIGAAVGGCPPEPWLRLRIGVRRFLDIDRRITGAPAALPSHLRADWWPRQHDIHFASNPAIAARDKLYGVISENDWNAHPDSSHVAAVRLTSKSKSARRRWEVPVGDGYVVTGDIYSVPLASFEQKAPPAKYPAQLSDGESAQIAHKQKATLTL